MLTRHLVRRAPQLLLATLLGLLLFGASAHVFTAQATSTTHSVGYIVYFGPGNNYSGPPGPGAGVEDTALPGSSVFVNAVDGTALPNGGTYTTADGTASATFTDVFVSQLNAQGLTALNGFDTILLYEFCTFGDVANANARSAINQFMQNGGKVIILGADKCSTAGGFGPDADFSGFLFPFTTSNPGPQGASGSYTAIEANTLTTGLSLGGQTGDSVGDANVFTTNTGGWCSSIQGQNALGTNSIVEGYVRSTTGGLAIYEGEDFWYTFGPTPHLQLLFDNILKQAWNPDGLPCGTPVTGIKLDPTSAQNPVGTSHTVTATVINTNNGNAPIVGATVVFSVTAGPNAGQGGSGVTDVNGQATFTYSDTGGAGVDTIIATTTDSTGAVHTSNTAAKTWSKACPPSDPTCNGGIGQTPELGSGELLATGLLPFALVLLYRRRQRRMQ